MPIIDKSIDTQRIIEDELSEEKKKSTKPIFIYEQTSGTKKAKGKGAGSNLGGLEEDRKRQKEEKEAVWRAEQARDRQREINASKERQAVADADLAAFNQGEAAALARRAKRGK